MNRRIVLLLCLFIFSRCIGQTKTSRYAGTKTPYTTPKQNYTAPPPGYKPVFVNYVGRHGARFMTKSGADKQAFDLLVQAEKENGLTNKGKLLKNSVQKILLIQQAGYEKITLLGAKEQKEIGQRIYDNYKTAFTGKGIHVQYTFKVRTQQSAEAFLSAYKKYNGPIIVEKNTDLTNTELRFYDLSPAYSSYKDGLVIQRALDSLEKNPVNATTVQNVCGRVFTKRFIEQLIADQKANRFVENLYELYAASLSITGEMQKKGLNADSIDIRTAFTNEDLYWLDFKSGAADFLEKGPGRDSLGIQVKVAIPLLTDFLNTTDSAIRYNKMDACFRFSHAEAISPFATLLSLSPASTASASIFNYAANWKTEDIIPLSANIQWIVYSDGRHYLIKVLLNEKEVELPVVSEKSPYYDWDIFREFYIKKLQNLHVNPEMDMTNYLKTLQN